MTNCKRIVHIIILLIALAKCEKEEFNHFTSNVPLHLTSPIAISSRQGGPIGFGLGGAPPIPPPQNNPVNPLGPVTGPGGGPDGIVPFGLNHIILIMVPMFKAKFQHLPKWLHSTIKISMPITVFFDKLTVPPGMFVPGLGGIPLPLGAPPTIGLQPPGIPTSPQMTPMIPQNAGGVSATNAQTTPGYAYSQPAYPHNSDGYDADVEPLEAYEEDESYDSGYPDEEQKRRWKRALFANQTPEKSGKKRVISFNETIHSAERAALLPKLEDLLENSGFGGKSCLLRAICEVHEAPLNHYGLLGELFTMFFSVSRSVFAESHLPEYLQAEEAGKTGDCTKYFSHCENTIFSWEEVKRTKKKKKNTPFIFNVIDEVL